MNKQIISTAMKFFYREGIVESREEMWRRLASWESHVSFNDILSGAAAIITGDYNVDVSCSLNEIKDFYFNGGLVI